MTTLRLVVIRHGDTDWSRERRFAGSRDVALAATGHAQGEAVARALEPLPVAAVYASPLERTRAFAEAIAKPHRLEVRLEAAFREMAFGRWEGLTREEVSARFPDLYATWRTAPERVTPPDGESLAEVAERVARGLEELREAHEGETVVLVTHAIVSRLIVLGALGLGLERLWSVDSSPAGITEIEYQGGWVTVQRMNTQAHLGALGA
ncbi:MAG: histidine phosphatase family protein [Candidatus Rokubacteria bacterium]|nr:histidine phosphatase family protein [Candidatus Rokubacteria bacterium]